MGTLFVTTKAVQYEITQIVTDYQIFDEGEVPAGLELDEVYPYLDTKAYTVCNAECDRRSRYNT